MRGDHERLVRVFLQRGSRFEFAQRELRHRYRLRWEDALPLAALMLGPAYTAEVVSRISGEQEIDRAYAESIGKRLSRLHTRGLITRKPDHRWQLTDPGRRAAATLLSALVRPFLWGR